MRLPLKRIVEKANEIAVQTGDPRVLDLAELIHDLAEHVQEQQDATFGPEKGEG